jgi:hypothetical protein
MIHLITAEFMMNHRPLLKFQLYLRSFKQTLCDVIKWRGRPNARNFNEQTRHSELMSGKQTSCFTQCVTPIYLQRQSYRYCIDRCHHSTERTAPCLNRQVEILVFCGPLTAAASPNLSECLKIWNKYARCQTLQTHRFIMSTRANKMVFILTESCTSSRQCLLTALKHK